jgi:acetyltransferase-like isoleucine patch superfamily enzyme
LPAFYHHPQALVESSDIGEGTRIWAFAHVMKGARIGANCNLGDHSFVESRVVLGNNVTVKNGVAIYDGVVAEDNVFIGPNAVFTNDRNPRAEIKKTADQAVPTRLREGATICANATVVCGVTVGRYAFVGAGAVVTRDVPDYALMVGVPARLAGYMCECGEKLSASRACTCGRRYQPQGNGLARADQDPPASSPALL